MFEDLTSFQGAAVDEVEHDFAEHTDFEAESKVSEPVAEAEADLAAMRLTVDDFTALEDRVLRAVGLVRRERQARAAAEEKAVALEMQLSEQSPLIEKLEKELDALRVEREQVRHRVERLLSQLDALEL